MDKRTLISGLIVLAVGIALWSVTGQNQIGVVTLILGYIVIFAGIVLIIYAFVLPDPPVHWNNNL